MARVLVVDDEPDAVELLQEFLTTNGYVIPSGRADGGRAQCSARTSHTPSAKPRTLWSAISPRELTDEQDGQGSERG